MNALSLVRGFARNNACANYILMEACNVLSLAELHEKRTSFFPTILMTLNHNLIVDWYYLDALLAEGRGRSVFDRGDEPFSELEPLREAQRAADKKLVAFTEELATEAALAKPVSLDRRDGTQVEETGNVLLHLFQHQIHHRGQAHAMLAGTRVPPPPLDEFFLEADLPLRKKPLDALGLPLR